MLQSLAFNEMDTRRQEVKTASTDTCAWAFESPDFTTFRKNGGLLWVKGKPGSGKSTLMREIVQLLQHEPPTHTIASFFFHGRGSNMQQSLLGLFRSILHQLSLTLPQLASKLTAIFLDRKSRMGTVGSSWDWTAAELQEIFSDHLRTASLERRTWIFLDALDEAGETVALELVSLLQDLLPDEAHSTPTIRNLGICFSCRHYPIVAENIGLEICVEHGNGQDISTFARQQLIPRMKETEANELCDFIEQKADGVFLWARLVLDQVLDLRRSHTVKHIRKQIEEIPAQLEDFYKEKLEDIRKEEDAQGLRILQWVYFAARPMTLGDLRIALLLDSKRPEKTLSECLEASDFVEEDTLLRNVILDRTRGLVQVIERPSLKVWTSLWDLYREYSFVHSTASLETTLGTVATESDIEYLSDWDVEDTGENGTHSDSENGEEDDLKGRSWTAGEYSTSDELSNSGLREVQLIHQSVKDFLQRFAGKLGIDSIQSNCLLFRSCMRFMSFPEYKLIGNPLLSSSERDQAKKISDTCSPWQFGIYATRFWYIHAKAAEDDPGVRNDLIQLLYTFDAFDHWRTLYPRICRDSNAIEPYNELDWLQELDYDHYPLTLKTSTSAPSSREPQTLLQIFALCRLFSMLDASPDFLELLAKPNNALKGRTLLDWAAGNDQRDVVRWCLSKEDWNPNQIDSRGRTPIRFLLWPYSWLNRFSVVEMFIQAHGVDINLPIYAGRTLLHDAVASGNFDVLRLILDRDDVIINSPDEKGWTPADVALNVSNVEALELLFSENQRRLGVGVSTSSIPWNREHSYHQFVEVLQTHSQLWQISEQWEVPHMTLLHFAAWKDHEDLCLFLLALGFDPNVKDDCGREPIHLAAASGHLKVVSLLMSSGAKRSTLDIFGHQPVHKAVIHGHLEVAQCIAREKRALGHDPMTPLLDAILEGRTEDAYSVCLSETDFEVTTSSRCLNLIGNAAAEGDFKIVQACIKRFDSAMEAGQYIGPLFEAARKGHADIAGLLLENGAAVDAEDQFGLTPLSEAVRAGQVNIARLFLENDANVDTKDHFDRTALHWAAESGNPRSVILLTGSGADTEVRDWTGRTPLHRAANRGRSEVVKELVNLGADLSAKTNSGETALDLARNSKTRDWLEIEQNRRG